MLKRDAVARVVLNNLFKHTELQTNFACNMLALVDGVPRTLTLDQFVSHWVTHQVEVIQRRTRYRLRKARSEAHIFRGLVKALDALDEVIALIRRSPDVDDARAGPDRAARHRRDAGHAPSSTCSCAGSRPSSGRRSSTTSPELERIIADLQDILDSPERQRQIISDELTAIVDKFGDDRRSQIIAADGDLSMEDLIPDEDLVVTITRGGYAKRTRADLYRTQKRGGKGVRGATLRGDDVVEHFMATSNHHWLLFFTTAGRVYRTKAYNLPEASRDAKGGHVAGLLSFQPDERIAQVLAIRDYEQAPYLVLATRTGLVKKTRLGDYNSPRQAGVIAINFRDDDDELIGAELCGPDDDILLISRKGQSIRFRADDGQLRPMGRATSGRQGHGLPRRRQHAVDVGDPRRTPRTRSTAAAVRLHDHRRRVRQAHRDRGVPPAVPRRPRHQDDEAGRRPGQPGRRLHRRRRRRGALHQAVRPGHPQRDRRPPAADQPRHQGREVRRRERR